MATPQKKQMPHIIVRYNNPYDKVAEQKLKDLENAMLHSMGTANKIYRKDLTTLKNVPDSPTH